MYDSRLSNYFKFNELTNIEKLFKDEVINSHLMTRALYASFRSICYHEMSVIKLIKFYNFENEEELLTKYSTYLSRRYDFVDLTNKIVYEFDGDQHFNLISFFDDDYTSFVNRRRSDIIKQRILVELGFDLVRVRSRNKLKVLDFISSLVSLNLKQGQSLLVDGNSYQVIDTYELETDESLYNKELLDKIKNFNRFNFEFDLSDEDLFNKECKCNCKNCVSQLDEESNDEEDEQYKMHLTQYLDSIIDSINQYPVIPVKPLYNHYLRWFDKQEFNDKNPLSSVSFVVELSSLSEDYGFKKSQTRSTYRTLEMKEELMKLLEFDVSELSKRQYSIEFDKITIKR